MANVGDENIRPNDREFKQQTPNTYKWALGASGLVAVATTAALSLAPEVAGQALAGLILFILLMFVVVSFENWNNCYRWHEYARSRSGLLKAAFGICSLNGLLASR